ncbi:E3 ubiquitin-protein ligase PUB23-like [Chenopodium quinoa]|uniref:U-box domain-containing protein n=1 Tax=Chenopodium quinoa TaxID=63459 RepID=A0A803KR99_CHEQI|nr:E3 ubiquitin-protein ligase PUB23-like [Chenopodium quinoa]
MEVNIEIPSHFLCPISLQLMRDPVTISTGITFDRDFIEKWLFSCNKTICPVTKQPLDDDVSCIITPNHTLRRLIQSWCTLHASYGVERIPTPTQPPTITQSNMSKLISDASKSPQQMRYTCLQRIRSFIVPATTHYYSSRCKNIIVTCGGLQYVADVLIEKDATRKEKEEALFILAQMDSYDQEFKSVILRNDNFADLFIDSLVGLLSSESSSNNERENAIKVMKMVYSVADPTRLGSVEHEMFALIVRVLRDKVSKEATKNALKLFVELNPWGRNRVKAVGSGAVHVLVELLLDGMLDRRISELALVVLDQLCGCAEGRADLVGHGAGLAVVSKKILRVSHVASDRAIRILSTISRYVGTAKVVGEMMEVGVVAKLCLVIQVDCSSKTKERAKEMLRLHSRVWKNSPCIPPHLISSYPTN